MLKPCDGAFLEQLAGVLPPGRLRPPQPSELEEPRGRWRGQAGAVAVPRSAAEVASVVRACAAARVGLIPFGGGTGLVCGQLMPDGPLPLLLSLAQMRTIRDVDARENLLIAEAGCILADVQAAAAAAERLFALSLASEGSARIGGILATNAGGVNVLRYGNARDLCLGLEAVLPDGAIWHGLKRLRKDNTGYDLRNLLIGAEGTLGVITAACLRLFPRPTRSAAAFMVVPGPEAALDLLAMAQGQIGEGISAFELISGTGLRFLATTMAQLRQPFAVTPEWVVLVDLGVCGTGPAPESLLEELFAGALGAGLVEDGVIAQSESQRAAFWSLREHIPEANRRIGAISSHDISLPLGAVAGFIAQAREALAQMGDFRVNCFGHLGDGNLHFNVFPPDGGDVAALASRRDAVSGRLHDLVHALGGSVSAEHGVGRLKVADLERYGDPAKLAAMRAIKAALDPAGIMNPGAVLRG